ncbi:BOS complex subunit NOMO1-like isoform X2 [Physella acuta]|uniref:BOS complex subunit NOMO1-like isoform X2 n=1 Tax=Physella acuta TaxID=109671 RepID=UPI0027DBAE46|nr:BOS complex subunit NOMO1-like isoform X2 [Physella acuta]
MKMSTSCFSANFENTSMKAKKFMLKTERESLSINEIAMTKTYAYSGDIELNIEVPEELAKVNATFNSELKTEKDKRIMYEERLMWGVDTNIVVQPGFTVRAELAVKEASFNGEFEMSVTFDGEVKLYTPHGSIKYQTDCAPNTGYYLIPLHDKGDYILKAEPPKGWGFEPASVELKVDGENDPCSKGEDINFKFTGFSIMGIVASLGQTSGPADVKLDLISSLKPDVLQSTLTDGKGSFVFSNVMPGDYKILASHSSWQFSKGEVTVHVKNDNANVGTGLTIGGYDVRGEVTGDGQPMKSVNFVLFSQNNQPTNVVQCEKGSPKGFLTKESKLTPLCYVTSKDDGSFVFPVVPSGSYFIIPFYKGEHITFDVEPEKLEFEVSHGSVILKEKFEIAGFSVSGKVLDKENGVGIPKATIIINGKDQTTSGSDGSFSLENMKTGAYRLTARVDNVAFEEMSVEITPKTPQLPNLIASGSNPLILTLTAIQHLALGTVTTDIPVDDIVITIKSSVDDIPTVLGPLKPNTTATSAAKASAASADKENKKQPTTIVYNFSHWARSGETLTVSAKSSDVLFYPSSVDAFISGDGCPGKIVDLIGRKGVFIEGKITPSLSGVTVTVSDESGTMTPIVLITDSQGKYRVGPLHADKKYLVAAEKEGYVMSKEKEDSLLFRAFKLGEIAVQMLDEKGQPLPSVLLSLSGDHQYRSNNVTGTDGHMIFTGLSPGQYFLRPMMKEYKFEPASQIIIVQEGTTEKISIKGARVAFSCFGKVTSLNGEPEPGIIIEALGKGDCSVYQEESKTETDGSYRIRGLQPNCLYDIHLKSGEVNTHIERTAPTARQVQVSTADLQDINIIAFRRMNQMDISGNIRTNLKFLHTLKVSLVSEAQPDTPIHIVALSKSSFFFLPTLVMDNKIVVLSAMVKLTLDFIARGTSGYTQKKRDETLPQYIRRLTHLYLENKNIDDVRLPAGEQLLFDPRTLNALSGCLQVLNVSGNHLTDINELSQLCHLSSLIAADNLLNGMKELAQLLATWTSLTRLDLTGDLPPLRSAPLRQRSISSLPPKQFDDILTISKTHQKPGGGLRRRFMFLVMLLLLRLPTAMGIPEKVTYGACIGTFPNRTCEVLRSEEGQDEFGHFAPFGYFAIFIALLIAMVYAGYQRRTQPADYAQRIPNVGARQFNDGNVEPLPAEDHLCEPMNDIMLVLDASRSIGPRQFEEILFFIVSIIRSFELDSQSASFAILKYSTVVHFIHAFSDEQERINLSKKVLSITYSGKETYLSRALTYILTRDLFSPSYGGRRKAGKIVFIVTDGVPRKDRPLCREKADQLRQLGIHVQCLGVGLQSYQYLVDICGSADNVFRAANFIQMHAQITSVVQRLCM